MEIEALAILISALITGIYLFLMLMYAIGWKFLDLTEARTINNDIFVSIIVPFRNEQSNLELILKSLHQQNYPKNMFEVILVNDHSTDLSLQIAENLSKNFKETNIYLINLAENEGSKKVAVNKGIKSSKGPLIVTTDADCQMHKNWLISIVSFYKKTKFDFISAPVAMKGTNSFFSAFQQIEFAGLVGSGAGSIFFRKPLMCNGANIAFERKLYETINLNDLKMHYASGEDVFLMSAAKKGNDVRYSFVKNKDCIVYTPVNKSFKEFINQRRRWVSKSIAYQDCWIIANSIIVFLMNASILTLAIGSIFCIELLPALAIAFISKSIADALLLFQVLSFFGQKNLIWWYPLAQILNSIYVPLIAIYGNLGKFHWKGRRTN